MDTRIPEPLSAIVAAPIIDDLLREGLPPMGLNIWVRSGLRCEYCGADLLSSPQALWLAESDHILPLSKYPELQDDPNNYAHTCGLCNKLKRNWNPIGNDPAFPVADHLTDDQRQQLIARCREYLKPLLGKKTQAVTAIKCVLQKHGQRS